MKIAFAGKGGVGKTTLAAWVGDYLARKGAHVWMIDADTALSLGQASGLPAAELPAPLVTREDLVRERIGQGLISISAQVDDLPESLAVGLPVSSGNDSGGGKRLLVMGTIAAAGGGCACSANALLKALLAHVFLERDDYVMVDLEAGVEHLGRGAVEGVDGLVVVSEPSFRGLETAAAISELAGQLGLDNQVLVLNRTAAVPESLAVEGLPERVISFPPIQGLVERQLASPSVLGLPEQDEIDERVGRLFALLEEGRCR
ncbi:carbon monoxide dehydrogenase [Oceanidesulfovibrio indonesiensis]|uniref:Carbon monoxide dehydrogenase n=1 Tax=Oceanidesulfovibrio indonesiensis TaxID=54767 RepID=A0A7M3MHW2_9BACT|nr:AAA family ATPase [Oceanidesulfovibrio indonesiensis]TVM19284.1 carbon monoxide dehydrogenase [Oceanidesulfovibrio indonesiensis]